MAEHFEVFEEESSMAVDIIDWDKNFTIL